MSPLDLIRSRDGSMSLTKLSASTFHALLATTVAWLTYKTQKFNEAMWMLYSALAVGHATYDKTMATIKDFKDKKLEASTPGTTTTQETLTTTRMP